MLMAFIGFAQSHGVEFRGLFPALIAHLNSNVFVASRQFFLNPPSRAEQKKRQQEEISSLKFAPF